MRYGRAVISNAFYNAQLTHFWSLFCCDCPLFTKNPALFCSSGINLPSYILPSGGIKFSCINVQLLELSQKTVFLSIPRGSLKIKRLQHKKILYYSHFNRNRNYTKMLDYTALPFLTSLIVYFILLR